MKIRIIKENETISRSFNEEFFKDPIFSIFTLSNTLIRIGILISLYLETIQKSMCKNIRIVNILAK